MASQVNAADIMQLLHGAVFFAMRLAQCLALKGLDPMTEKERWRLIAKVSPHLFLGEIQVLHFLHLEMIDRGPEPLFLPARAIAQRIGVCRSAAEYSLRNLTNIGVLDRTLGYGPGNPYRYTINFAAIAALSAPQRKRRALPPRNRDRAKARPRERGRARERDRSPA